MIYTAPTSGKNKGSQFWPY